MPKSHSNITAVIEAKPTNHSFYPKMLIVETGYLEGGHKYFPTDDFVNYRIYEKVPKLWRKIEQLLRMDFYLALQVKRLASQYDVIWANSEKVAIPLSFMNLGKTLIVILQYPESSTRSKLIKYSGIAKKWDGVGIVAKESRSFIESNFGVKPEKIFQYYSARTEIFKPAKNRRSGEDGAILSIGVAKRDYDTMIEALSELPGYQTDIHISSKYGDKYNGRASKKPGSWIRFPDRIPDRELPYHYQNARFVVVPLIPTCHSGAGVTSVFEASASGKAVIATDTGGMRSYVIHGKTGLLVPPRDVGAMRSAIKTLWEDPELANTMGMAGRKFVEENYSSEVISSGIVSFLEKIWDFNGLV